MPGTTQMISSANELPGFSLLAIFLYICEDHIQFIHFVIKAHTSSVVSMKFFQIVVDILTNYFIKYNISCFTFSVSSTWSETKFF